MLDVCFIFQALCWEDFNWMLGTSQFRSWPEDEKIVTYLLQTWWCSSKVKWWKKHPSPICLSFPCLSPSYSLTSLPWSVLPSSLFLAFLSSLALLYFLSFLIFFLLACLFTCLPDFQPSCLPDFQPFVFFWIFFFLRCTLFVPATFE